MKHPVLLDNTVLTNFAWVQSANLPLDLWPGRVCTTQTVMEEYRAGVTEVGLPADVWDHLLVLQLSDEERKWAKGYLPANLGLGERTCLAAARHRQGMIASDDLRARKTAQSLNLPVVGSIGILIRCVQSNLLALDQAQVLLEQMIIAGYYAPVKSLAAFFNR